MSALIFADMLDSAATPWLELPEHSSRPPGAAPPPAAHPDADELACAVAMTPVAGVRTGKVSSDGAGPFPSTQENPDG